MFTLFSSPDDKQYRKTLAMLCAHVNNLPISYNLPEFINEMYAIVLDLNNSFVKSSSYLERFWQIDLPTHVESWIKNIAIFLFLKQNIQMNCVKANGRMVFINMNNIYLSCDNEDEYYTDRFRPEAPSFVEDVFAAIQKFVAQFVRTDFLELDQQHMFAVDVGNRRYEFLYTKNFFVEGGRVCLYRDEEQALLEAVQSLDNNGIVDKIFENPILSGKNFYDLFLLALVSQEFILGCLRDQQLNTPLFQEALKENQLDIRKALYFLTSVITDHLPNLYSLRCLLNKPNSEEWKSFQQKVIVDLKKCFLSALSPDVLLPEKDHPSLYEDAWHHSWAVLTLMDVIGMPTGFVGSVLKPETCLPLTCMSDSDYQISTSLVYKSLPILTGHASDAYQPFLELSITSSKQLPLGIHSTIEIALPAHLEKFLNQDLRCVFNLWTTQMLNLGQGIISTTNTSLSVFLEQIPICIFFDDVLGDKELKMNFSRRLGFYFWQNIRKSSVLLNPNVEKIIRDFLINKMSLVDTDMC